jgi:hypothetical protein
MSTNNQLQPQQTERRQQTTTTSTSTKLANMANTTNNSNGRSLVGNDALTNGIINGLVATTTKGIAKDSTAPQLVADVNGHPTHYSISSTLSINSSDASSTLSIVLPVNGGIDSEITAIISLIRPSQASNVTREWVRRFICAVIKEAYVWVNQYLDKMGVATVASLTNDAKSGGNSSNGIDKTDSSNINGSSSNNVNSNSTSSIPLAGTPAAVVAGEPFRYGSVELGTYLPTGDIDIGVMVPTPFLQLWFETLRGFLQAQKCVRGVFVVDAEVHSSILSPLPYTHAAISYIISSHLMSSPILCSRSSVCDVTLVTHLFWLCGCWCANNGADASITVMA